MSQPPLLKSLNLWDVVAMNIVAIVGLRWIARSARVGAPSVTLWILACLVFFVPLAMALVDLSSRYPDQGGIYAWVRRAFGPGHGYACGWCMWVNNLFYFPSLLLFAAANLTLVVGGPALADDRAYSVIFVLVSLWALTALNLIGLSAGKWLQHVGSVATWLPAVLLMACGAAALAMFGSATSFAPARLVPHEDVLSTLSLWSAMCFAFSGFEITSMVGQEVKQPTRTIPLGILLSGVAITAIYILSSGSVLVAVPAEQLAERSGIADAVELVTGRLGLAGFGGFTGLLLTVGAIAGASSWIAGSARVPFAAGVDAVLPAAFARLHPRHRTPYVALIVQSAAATVLFLASVVVSAGGGQTSVQEAYDIMVNLTILLYFVPYLYLFAAYLRLRREPVAAGSDAERFQIARAPAAAWTVGLGGFAATLIAVVLVFVPPTGTTNVWNYELNLVGQSLLLFAAGAAFWMVAGRTKTRLP